MATNDVIVLNSILAQKTAQGNKFLSDSEQFELFTFEQVLKDYDLSYDELLTGRVGGSDDGGIDGFFAFINRELLDEDTELDSCKKYPIVELFLIQSKQTTSFGETTFERIASTSSDIFDLTKDMLALQSFYNPILIERAEIFRKAFLALASRHPVLRITCIYASKGDTDDIHPKVNYKADGMRKTLSSCFSGATVNYYFLGAKELLDAARLEKTYTLQLKFLENYISRGEDNYIILSKLKDYYEFIVDETGNIRRYIFQSNVRDYQGDVEVNKEIFQTLGTNDLLDFWWLNNGITILASKATVAGKSITLDDVQVVNGLQTTETIFNFWSQHQDKQDDRALLIKIIVTGNSEARDRIIKATNYQTKIPDASLRATDRIQRDLEDYFKSHGWFYDRRKNYYKNQGKPPEKIISIPYLAQALMAIGLKEPNNSRARPSSLIKRDSDYARVFNPNIDLAVYLFCAKLMKHIDGFIRTESSPAPWHQKSNLRFHLAMYTAIKLLGKKEYHPPELASIANSEITDSLLVKGLETLITWASEFSEKHDYQFDRTCKSKEFDLDILSKF